MRIQIGSPEDQSYSSAGPVRRGRGFRVFPLILFGLFFAYYYFGHRQPNSYTGRSQLIDLTKEQEVALGLQSYQQVLSDAQVISSGPDYERVQRVGRRIAKVIDDSDYQWEFSLIESPQVNAFCLPGGKVAVYSGLLRVAQSDDGLATVMGHEIAHALARHGAERMAHEKLAQLGQLAMQVAVGEMDSDQQRMILGAFGAGAQYGVMLPFSRSHESEADKVGLQLMARACYDPAQSIDFWKRMAEATSGAGKPPEFASTHPSDATRIEQLSSWLPEAAAIRHNFCQ